MEEQKNQQVEENVEQPKAEEQQSEVSAQGEGQETSTEEQKWEVVFEDGTTLNLTKDTLQEMFKAQMEYQKLMEENKKLKEQFGRFTSKKEETMPSAVQQNEIQQKISSQQLDKSTIETIVEEVLFKEEVSKAVRQHPILSKMGNAGNILALEAIQWGLEQNKNFASYGEVIDNYLKTIGFTQNDTSAKVGEKIVEKIVSNIRENTPAVSGSSGSVDILNKYLSLSPQDRIEFEKTLTPEQSRELGLALQKMGG